MYSFLPRGPKGYIFGGTLPRSLTVCNGYRYLLYVYNVIIAYNNYLCLIIIGTPHESFGRPIIRPIANLPHLNNIIIIISTIAAAAAGRMRRFYSLLFYTITGIMLPTSEGCYYYSLLRHIGICWPATPRARVLLRMH